MTIIWEFRQEKYIWLEWLEGATTRIRKFTYEAYEKFMSKYADDDLDFLE